MKSLVKISHGLSLPNMPNQESRLFVAVFRGHEGKGTWLLKASVNYVQELIFISSVVSFIEHWGRKHTELTRTISALCWPHRLLEESPSVLCLLPYKCQTELIRIRNTNFRSSIWLFLCCVSLRLQCGPLSFIRKIHKYSSFFIFQSIVLCWKFQSVGLQSAKAGRT